MPSAPKKATKKDLVSIMPYLEPDQIARVILSSQGFEEALSPFLSSAKKSAYPADPATFMTKVLGYQMWQRIKNICDSVRDHHNTVVASGFGIGKSLTAASLACWFMTVFEPAIVITLAPTFSQVNNVIWRYIRTAGRRAGLPGVIYDTPRWEITSEHYAVGLSPRRTSSEDIATLQGYHGPRVLVIMDEAAGLPRMVWEVVSSLAIGDNCRVLAIGNPIEQSGPFWDACSSTSWNSIRISCMDHPNVLEGREVIPGAVTRGWIEERAQEWATPVEKGTIGAIRIPWLDQDILPMPIFEAKVLGAAPPQAEDQLIHLRWVEEAQLRTVEERNVSVVMGFDPAPRGGDDNALAIRMGNKVIKVLRRKGDDTQELAEWLAMEMREWDSVICYIDDIGSGAGVVDKARAMGLPVVAVNSARASSEPHRFANLRAECWWRVRELLREGRIELPNDSLLEGDLCAPKFGPDSYGRTLIEDKEEIRKRIKRSPDSGDALCLSYARPVVDTDENLVSRLKELAGGVSRWAGGVSSRWEATVGGGHTRSWRGPR